MSVRLQADKRPRKTSNKDDNTPKDEIAEFFKSKTYTDGRKCTDMIPALRKTLLGLESGYKIEPERFNVSSTRSDCLGLQRQEKVIREFRTLESQSHVTESQRRLWLLRISYEIDRLLPLVELRRNEKSDIAAAEREFARLSHEDPKSIRNLRKIGHKYTVIADREHGLGFLLLLGCQTRSV